MSKQYESLEAATEAQKAKAAQVKEAKEKSLEKWLIA